MKNFTFLLILFLVTLSTSCFALNTSKESICLIPKGFVGPVFIVFDQKDGITPEVENNFHIYRIPENGILKVKNKVDFNIKERIYFHVDENGARMKIEYLYAGGGAWKDKKFTFDSVDKSSQQVFVMMDEMGGTANDQKGNSVRFRQFIVGKIGDAEKFALQRHQTLCKALGQECIFNTDKEK